MVVYLEEELGVDDVLVLEGLGVGIALSLGRDGGKKWREEMV